MQRLPKRRHIRLALDFKPPPDFGDLSGVGFVQCEIGIGGPGSPEKQRNRSCLLKRIDIQGRQRTVLGVMPPGFDLHDARAQLWVPLGLDPNNRQNTFLSYYTWGSGIGLALDLSLRTSFQGPTLDHLMRDMWLTHGVGALAS